MPVYTSSQLLESTAKIEHIINPFLTEGGTMLISAGEKSLKTYVGMNMGMAVATGKLLFNKYSTKKRRVLYIDQEIGLPIAKSRHWPMHDFYNDKENNFRLYTSDAVRLSLDDNIKAKRELDAVIERELTDGGLIVWDTLKDSTSFLESSADEMSLMFNRLDDIKKKYGLSAILLHHSTKPDVNDNTSPRGSTVITARPTELAVITKLAATDDDTLSRINIKWRFRSHSPLELKLDFVHAPQEYHPDTFIKGTGVFTIRKEKATPKPAPSDPDAVGNHEGANVSALADLLPESEASREDREAEERKQAAKDARKMLLKGAAA